MVSGMTGVLFNGSSKANCMYVNNLRVSLVLVCYKLIFPDGDMFYECIW